MATSKGITEAQRIDAALRYAAGEQAKDIAAELGICASSLSYHFRKVGVPRRVEATATMDCEECGKTFTYIKSHAPNGPRRFCGGKCRDEASRGDRHSCWLGVPTMQKSSGYRFAYVPKDHISRQTDRRRRKDRAPEHVLIAETALGRPLKKGEVVHHINGDKLDNRNCNLLVCTRSYHAWLHGEMSRRWAREQFGKAA